MEHKILYNKNEILVRNIKLIDIDDPIYVESEKHFRNKRLNIKERLRKKGIEPSTDYSLRNYEHLTILLEKIVNHWVKSSNKRILYWEEFYKDKWDYRFMEIDFVIEKDETIFIGEVKTQLTKGSKNNLSTQIRNRRNLLNCLDTKFEYMGILVLVDNSVYIDDNGEEKTPIVDKFQKNIFDTESVEFCIDDFKILKSRIHVEDIFNYGIENNIVINHNLLNEVYEEIRIKKEIKEEEINNLETSDGNFNLKNLLDFVLKKIKYEK